MAVKNYQSYQPIRVRLHGDQVAARGLVRTAQKQMNLLLQQMAFQNLQQSYRQVEPEPGTIINVSSSHGQRWIDIFVPPTEHEQTSIEDLVGDQKCCATIAHSECQIVGVSAVEGGWRDAHGEEAVAYDVLLCIRSSQRTGLPVGMSQLIERVRASDFTKYLPGDYATIIFFRGEEDAPMPLTLSFQEKEALEDCMPLGITGVPTFYGDNWVMSGIGRDAAIYDFFGDDPHVHPCIVPVGRVTRADDTTTPEKPYSYSPILCTDEEYRHLVFDALTFYAPSPPRVPVVTRPIITGAHEFSRSVHSYDPDYSLNSFPPAGDIITHLQANGSYDKYLVCFRPPWHEKDTKRVTLADPTSPDFVGGSFVIDVENIKEYIYISMSCTWAESVVEGTTLPAPPGLKDIHNFATIEGIILGFSTYAGQYDDWATTISSLSVPFQGFQRILTPIPSYTVFFFYNLVDEDSPSSIIPMLDAVDLLSGARPTHYYKLGDSDLFPETIQFPVDVTTMVTDFTTPIGPAEPLEEIFTFHNTLFPTRPVSLPSGGTEIGTGSNHAAALGNPIFEPLLGQMADTFGWTERDSFTIPGDHDGDGYYLDNYLPATYGGSTFKNGEFDTVTIQAAAIALGVNEVITIDEEDILALGPVEPTHLPVSGIGQVFSRRVIGACGPFKPTVLAEDGAAYENTEAYLAGTHFDRQTGSTTPQIECHTYDDAEPPNIIHTYYTYDGMQIDNYTTIGSPPYFVEYANEQFQITQPYELEPLHKTHYLKAWTVDHPECGGSGTTITEEYDYTEVLFDFTAVDDDQTSRCAYHNFLVAGGNFALVGTWGVATQDTHTAPLNTVHLARPTLGLQVEERSFFYAFQYLGVNDPEDLLTTAARDSQLSGTFINFSEPWVWYQNLTHAETLVQEVWLTVAKSKFTEEYIDYIYNGIYPLWWHNLNAASGVDIDNWAYNSSLLSWGYGCFLVA